MKRLQILTYRTRGRRTCHQEKGGLARAWHLCSKQLKTDTRTGGRSSLRPFARLEVSVDTEHPTRGIRRKPTREELFKTVFSCTLLVLKLSQKMKRCMKKIYQKTHTAFNDSDLSMSAYICESTPLLPWHFLNWKKYSPFSSKQHLHPS